MLHHPHGAWLLNLFLFRRRYTSICGKLPETPLPHPPTWGKVPYNPFACPHMHTQGLLPATQCLATPNRVWLLKLVSCTSAIGVVFYSPFATPTYLCSNSLFCPTFKRRGFWNFFTPSQTSRGFWHSRLSPPTYAHRWRSSFNSLSLFPRPNMFWVLKPLPFNAPVRSYTWSYAPRTRWLIQPLTNSLMQMHTRSWWCEGYTCCRIWKLLHRGE